MRPLAILPLLCCMAALILSFLCLFAGHKKSFMEDYHILTLNTSRIGASLVNSTTSSSSTVSSIWNLLPSSIQDDISDAAESVADELGIEDFYSAHMLDYCWGQYTPTEVANATVPAKDIHKNVTGCSNQTAMFWFNPEEILEKALNKSGVNVTLEDLDWPSSIQDGLDALRIASSAAFVLYCIAIALIFVAMLAAVPALIADGRLSACLNFMVGLLAFLAIGLGSALTTAVIVKGCDVINKYGKDIGIEAKKGGKFLALTWAATGLMFVVMVVWSWEVCCGARRRKSVNYVGAKHG